MISINHSGDGAPLETQRTPGQLTLLQTDTMCSAGGSCGGHGVRSLNIKCFPTLGWTDG
jgi:hypothetical protein